MRILFALLLVSGLAGPATASDTEPKPISGFWSGTYSHSQKHQSDPVKFSASLVQNNQSLGGELLEELPPNRRATIEKGKLDTKKVSFVLKYDGKKSQPMHCTGTLSADRKSIAGAWNIKGRKDAGSFEMTRTGDLPR